MENNVVLGTSKLKPTRVSMCVTDGTASEPLQGALPRLILQHVLVVRRVHLLQEDECQHRVGSQTSVVRGKAFPQTEESLLTNHLGQHVLFTNERTIPWHILNKELT